MKRDRGDLYWSIYTFFNDPPYIQREKKPCVACKVLATAMSSGVVALSAYHLPQAIRTNNTLKKIACGSGIAIFTGTMIYSLSQLVAEIKPKSPISSASSST